MGQDLIKRITLNPDVCFGKPTIRNMRYPVEMILDLLSAGMSPEELIEDYPALEGDDIKACLLFASKLIKVNSISKSNSCIMKFIVDAQLPFKLKKWLNEQGHDAIHTDDLPTKHLTPDSEIIKIAEKEDRIVVSKDSDFLSISLD